MRRPTFPVHSRTRVLASMMRCTMVLRVDARTRRPFALASSLTPHSMTSRWAWSWVDGIHLAVASAYVFSRSMAAASSLFCRLSRQTRRAARDHARLRFRNTVCLLLSERANHHFIVFQSAPGPNDDAVPTVVCRDDPKAITVPNPVTNLETLGCVHFEIPFSETHEITGIRSENAQFPPASWMSQVNRESPEWRLTTLQNIEAQRPGNVSD